MSKDFYTASELADLGYVSERLTSVFGEPDSVDGEFRWDADTLSPSSGTYSLLLPGSCSMPSLRSGTHGSR